MELAILVAAGLLAVLLWNAVRIPPGSGRFSHVTEEQFLSAIPSADPEIALKVRSIVSDQLDVPLDEIHPDSHFIDDLKCD